MMSNSELIVNEFKRRIFTENYARIFKCLSMISEEELWYSPNKSTPSIGSLVLHLCGNCKQWILCSLGNELNNRDREKEFEKHTNIKKSELVFVMENLKVKMLDTLESVSDEDLTKSLEIRGKHESVFAILVHVIEHFSYHTGQVATLTKLITNRSTSFNS